MRGLMVLPDDGATKVALATIVANYAIGDPVWTLEVGAPGSGKSEGVNAVQDAPDVRRLSSLTPQTLLSGYEPKRKGAPEASLLLKVGGFGILAFKDLTTVLTMHHEARSQIVGQLREVYDGATQKAFGNGREVSWEGKLGLLAGVTPVIDEQHSFLALMGERFVLYRLPEASREEVARHALAVRNVADKLREEIRAECASFLARFRGVQELDIPDGFVEPLVRLSDIVTRARTGVARDYRTRELLYLPTPEAPPRLAKQLAQLAAGLLAIGVDEHETLRLIRKIGWDCVPAVRTTVMAALAGAEGGVPNAELQELTSLPRTTAERVAEDLALLGLVKRWKADDGKWRVAESDLAREYAATHPGQPTPLFEGGE
jgi:hypothetical protein